jgi:hypothetical protein
MDKTNEQQAPVESATIGRRLITYNLLNSALSCVGAEHRWASLIQVEDLGALVDLFCLYDGVVLLGHNWKWHSHRLAKRNELAAALVECDFIHEIDPWRFADFEGENLERVHAKHLAVFLGQKLDTFADRLPTVGGSLSEDYVEFLTGFHDYGEVAVPVDLMGHLRTWDSHVDLGGAPDQWSGQMRWVRTVPSRSAMVTALAEEIRQGGQRMHQFIKRTFVYIAYADVLRIPFTPDSARHPVVERIVTEENQFRGRLQSILKSVVAETTPGDKDLLRRVPPLAAVLFDRAQTVHDIVPELLQLRKDLAPLRKTLRKFERQMLYDSRDTAIKTKKKWDQAVDEVERNFGIEPRLITGKRALQLGESLGEAVDNPTSLKSWWAAFTQLPAEVIRRLIARHTLIELHRLRPELPASERLRSAIQRIFQMR